MATAFLFPGQGSQEVGMGHALAEAFPSARAVFDEVDDALGQKLSEIMWNGPAEELTLTANAQPALMAVSLAIMRVLEHEHGFNLASSVSYVAGHSLGEYSALAAGGAISLTDTARLLRLRGQSMQEAVPVGTGAMAAMLGIELEAAKTLADAASEGEVCEVANDNAPGQVVLSGATTAVERAVGLAKQHGARRAIMLNVSAPFHCALMAPAANVMQQALAEIDVSSPQVPLVSNVTASAIDRPDEIRKRLSEQVTGTVRWRESIAFMNAQNIQNYYEIGSGKVLSGLVRQIDRTRTSTPVNTPEAIAELAAAIRSA